MQPDYITSIHEIQIGMIKDLHEYCNRHQIKYSAIGGTLLGAVRHKGFIPWDDDVDIALVRREYDKLLKCLKEEPMEGYFLQDFSTEKHYIQPFAKLRKDNTLYIEEYNKNADIHHGIFIDIFPLDKIKKPGSFESKFRRIVTRQITFAIWRKEKCPMKRKGAKKFEYITGTIISLFPKNILVNLQNMLAIREHKEWDYVASIFSSNYGTDKFYLLCDEMELLDEVEFEDTVISGTRAKEQYLSRLFNNYMELPPENKRNSGHNVCEVKFEMEENN